jgi:hypothetical protein
MSLKVASMSKVFKFLKIWDGYGPLEWYHLSTKYCEDLPSGSKFIRGGHRQT